jgi:hypothetical protein
LGCRHPAPVRYAVSTALLDPRGRLNSFSGNSSSAERRDRKGAILDLYEEISLEP